MNDKVARIVKMIEDGQHEKGLQELATYVKKADDETKRDIAELYFQLGLVDKALEITEELMFSYPDNGELFAFASECYIELGKEQEALDMLNEIKKEDPAFLQAQLLLADLYESQGLEEVAEQKLLEAIKQLPNEVVLLYGLGEFYLNRGDFKQAISYYKRVIHQEDLSDLPVDPRIRLAEAFSATGQFEEALDYYKKGLQEERTTEAMYGYGVTAMQLEDYETAIDAFTVVLKQDPDFTTAYANLGKAYMAIKKWEDAQETFEEGLRRDEYNESLYLELARLLLSQGHGEDGQVFLEKVIALNPSNLSAVTEALRYYDDVEDYDAMLDLVRFLDDYNEFDPLFERYRAKALYEADDLSSAIQAYDIAIADLAEEVTLYEEAYPVYLANGQKGKAIELLRKIVTLDPEREDITMRLEDLEQES